MLNLGRRHRDARLGRGSRLEVSPGQKYTSYDQVDRIRFQVSVCNPIARAGTKIGMYGFLTRTRSREPPRGIRRKDIAVRYVLHPPPETEMLALHTRGCPIAPFASF